MSVLILILLIISVSYYFLVPKKKKKTPASTTAASIVYNSSTTTASGTTAASTTAASTTASTTTASGTTASGTTASKTWAECNALSPRQLLKGNECFLPSTTQDCADLGRGVGHGNSIWIWNEQEKSCKILNNQIRDCKNILKVWNNATCVDPSNTQDCTVVYDARHSYNTITELCEVLEVPCDITNDQCDSNAFGDPWYQCRLAAGDYPTCMTRDAALLECRNIGQAYGGGYGCTPPMD